MRRPVEVVLTVVCVLLALIGLALIVFLGPDSRRTTGPHEVDTNAVAIVTKPGVISWTGLSLDVLVEVPVNRPVFVGLGNAVDVSAYVKGTHHTQVTKFERPFTPTYKDVKGAEFLSGAPTAADWWVAADAGLGAARISTELPDETVSLAIVAVGTSDLRGLEVSLAWGVKGGFLKGIGLLLIGLGGLLFLRLLKHGAQLWAERRAVLWETEEVEEVVYVWVDEFGQEHEVKPGDPDYEEFAAAERGEVLDVEGEVEESEPPAARRDLFGRFRKRRNPKPDNEVAVPPAGADSLFGDSDPSLSGDTPDPDARAAESPPQSPAPTPAAAYFWVDEDGVEQEMTADEVASMDWDDYDIEPEEDK